MSRMKRKGVTFAPIIWIPVRLQGRNAWEKHRQAVNWCRQNAGVYRADWNYYGFEFKFRDQEMAALFALTWV